MKTLLKIAEHEQKIALIKKEICQVNAQAEEKKSQQNELNNQLTTLEKKLNELLTEHKKAKNNRPSFLPFKCNWKPAFKVKFFNSLRLYKEWKSVIHDS